MKCEKSYGPFFGGSELLATEPFNGNNKCMSYANNMVYRITMDGESNSSLTSLKCKNKGLNSYQSEFTISELEVWEVIFEK